MTSERQHEMKIVMQSPNGEYREVHYDNFAVGTEDEDYKITVGGYSSEEHVFVRDALKSVNGRPFEYKKSGTSSCGHTGWCDDSGNHVFGFFGENLNKVDAESQKGVFNYFFGGKSMSYNRMEVMIRPKG